MRTYFRVYTAIALISVAYLFLNTTPANAWQTDGSVEFTMTTESYKGRYGPRNIGAIWVTTAQGQFVQTIELWARSRANHLTEWRQSSNDNYVDAMTSATLRNHETHTISWDCTDANGNLVPDGTYHMNLEFTEDNSSSGRPPSQFAYVEFTKGSASQTLNPTDDGNFRNMQLVYTASGSGGSGSNPASLAGTVTNSQNSAGISGASIELLQASTSVYSATSNGTGSFTLNDIAAGNYTLRITASGFENHSESISLSDGQNLTGFSVALTPITSTASLSGTVYLSGTNTQISNATVQLSVNNQVVETTTTSGFGAFNFTNIDAGNYTLSVSHPNYQNFTETISLSAGENATNHAVYLAQAQQNAAISGVVRDVTTQYGVDNAKVELTANNTSIATTTTTATGAYEINNLAGGTYTLRVTKSGYQVATKDIAVNDGETLSLTNFSLVPQQEFASLSGTIEDAASTQAIANATVQLKKNNVVFYETITDATGSYTFENIDPDSYEMVVQKTGYQTTSKNISLNAGENNSQENVQLPQSGQQDTTPPQVPNNLNASLNGTRVSLTWNNNPASDLQGYFVHIGTSNQSFNQKIDVGKTTSYQTASLATNTRYYFAVSAYDASGNESARSTSVDVLTPVDGNTDPDTHPEPGEIPVTMSYNFPNPFKPGEQQTTLRYELTQAEEVTIKIYDLSNRLVKTLLENQSRLAGIQTSDAWDGNNESGQKVANGVYFARIETGTKAHIIRIVVVH